MKRKRIMVIEDDKRGVKMNLYNDGTYSPYEDNVDGEDEQ